MEKVFESLESDFPVDIYPFNLHDSFASDPPSADIVNYMVRLDGFYFEILESGF